MKPGLFRACKQRRSAVKLTTLLGGDIRQGSSSCFKEPSRFSSKYSPSSGRPRRQTVGWLLAGALRRDDDVLERKVCHDQQTNQHHDYRGPPE